MARFCGKCGTATREGSTFCGHCGQRLTQRANSGPPSVPGGSSTATGVSAPTFREGQQAPPSAPSASPYASSTPAASPAASSKPPGSSDPSKPGGNPYAPPPPPPASTVSRIPDSDRPLLAALDESQIDKARQVIRNYSLASAGLFIMPMPFAHLIVLVPVQSAMVLKVSRIFGNQDPPEKLLAYIAATSGVSIFGQISAAIVSTLIPVVGGLVSAPFIYGWTYGLGEVAIRYFQAQGEVDDNEMETVFKQASKSAQKRYKSEQKMSREQSLEVLRGDLSPQEYDRLQQKIRS